MCGCRPRLGLLKHIIHWFSSYMKTAQEYLPSVTGASVTCLSTSVVDRQEPAGQDKNPPSTHPPEASFLQLMLSPVTPLRQPSQRGRTWPVQGLPTHTPDRGLPSPAPDAAVHHNRQPGTACRPLAPDGAPPHHSRSNPLLPAACLFFLIVLSAELCLRVWVMKRCLTLSPVMTTRVDS